MREELPIACNLVGGEQDRRKEAVSDLLNTSHLTPPFFRFELVFEPGGGDILLRVTGPEDTKQFMNEAFFLASSF